jgi:plasmid stabilization system protein ParE
MARGSKASYSNKQKRQAEHIEKGYEKKGVSAKTAKARAWATVNKETGGGKKKGSGRGKSKSKSSSSKSSSKK